MRVLIVDDEPALSDHLARALGAAGYAVDVAADGEQADFSVRTESYDAVLLDLGLPKVDGLTLLRSSFRHEGVPVWPHNVRQRHVQRTIATADVGNHRAGSDVQRRRESIGFASPRDRQHVEDQVPSKPCARKYGARTQREPCTNQR